MITAAMARHAAAVIPDLTWDEDGATGNQFTEHEPDTPDLCVTWRLTTGQPQLTARPVDLPLVQAIVRGPIDDLRSGFTLAEDLLSQFGCLDSVTLAAETVDEVDVITCTPAQSAPTWLGFDSNRRPRWSLNWRLSTHAPTAHRS